MKNIILEIEEKIYSDEDITFNEAITLFQSSYDKNLNNLLDAANRIRNKFNGNIVDLCSIMNAKSGRCSEDCKFCAQSEHYNTNIKKYNMINMSDALNLAKENKEHGINRFSLVTSGKALTSNDFEKALEIYKEINKRVNINLCASLGILSYNQLLQLKNVGVTMYHHNLETSREYYNKICTTHSYDERIETINNAKKAGLMVCSGGIIGMGETITDRIKLAFELKSLQIQSIPINILNPVKGTPLEYTKRLEQNDILKTIAIFRFINPKASIRLAGGRNLIDNFGKGCFRAGANATISGNYLTTSGNKINDDIEMIKSLGLSLDI
ncbi:biotin synthase [Clostridium tetani]|uniref:Biotin synthase n=1 Tax=Clostridium tetani (strain Massachusetts / E88) TaxID=212717 RepID=BIOB_CLOTE|nr:biotin synthase BioB [Clostridium tetani]Q899M1.1 RecName: Full=Biotin synthase [Clostridium tetani E88]AAO34803.1 biotin synthase [Clostridium tetani E88]KGI36496.1 biotin synthase [Clostridium tetani]KGI38824.1 biotin synthase [Clostridium tetani ATCC 9441]KGI42576.1 biotin synthase [Clostridium tetani]KHO38693.1 biotin synthase [Clostridium tetani]